MAWFVLMLGALFQLVWIYALILSEGFTRFGPSLLSLEVLVASLGLLSWSVRNLPLPSAYAVWMATGTFGACLIGLFLFPGSASPTQLMIGAITAGGFVLMILPNSK